jgi:hypothetical protein
MEIDPFQLAAERAESSLSVRDWQGLKPSERIAAIYRELRKLDAQSVAFRVVQSPDATVSRFRS